MATNQDMGPPKNKIDLGDRARFLDRVQSEETFASEVLQPGDVLACGIPEKTIFHYGVVVGFNGPIPQIVHFYNDKVRSDLLAAFWKPEDHLVFLVPLAEEMDRDAIVDRANRLVDASIDQWGTRTCQHFAGYCLTGDWTKFLDDDQVRDARVSPISLPPSPPPRQKTIRLFGVVFR